MQGTSPAGVQGVTPCLSLFPKEVGWLGTKYCSWIVLSHPFAMSETQEQWNNRQAIELLAQHIPFERDTASKAEQIEMLRGLVIRHGRNMDPELFGFDARNELIRLGLWDRIGPEHP